MMSLRRLGLLGPSALSCILSLWTLPGCVEGAAPAGRDDNPPAGSDDDGDIAGASDEDDVDATSEDDVEVTSDDDVGSTSEDDSDDDPPAGEAEAGRGPNVDTGADEQDDAGDQELEADAAADGAGPDAPDDDAGTGSPEGEDLGEGDGRDVITIGDSWMLLLGTGIQESLTETSGQPYRKYARPGTRLLNGVIPGQYATAKRADPDIKTVVMSGGGNDIIQNSTLKSDCMRGGEMCEAQVERIRTALAELWKQMSADGVRDVVHVMYSASAGSGVKNRDAHNASMAEVCAAVPEPLRCHLVNTDTLIGPRDMRSDGIHPTDSGYDKIGEAVFALMQEEGMRR